MNIYVLIDDDELVRMTWTFKAEANQVKLQTYASVELFLKDEKNLSRDSLVYLDSDLGDVLGEEFVLTLHQLGFLQVHLATGKDASEVIKNVGHFISISGKEPPF
jgi:FixJ family two-component response regulator